MIIKPRITIFSHDTGLTGTLEIRLQSRGYQVLTQKKLTTFLGFIYSDPPDLVLIDISSPSSGIRNLIRSLKDDSYFSVVPVLGLITGSNSESFPWDDFPLDDFTFLPIRYDELFARIDISIRRIHRVFDNNPLTRLPGNTSVQQAITEAIGKPKAVCYIDINHFKPYNDVYGFTRGDEVLRMLARIMSNSVKETGGGFVGHIGGDDFVFIIPQERVEKVCTTIIDNFSFIALDLFDEKEKENGYYLGLDRKGQEERFPLLTIAIAVVPTDTPKIKHCGKIAEMAAEVKKLAKKSDQSCFVVDQRKK